MTTPYIVQAPVPLIAQHMNVFTGAQDPNSDLDCGESCIKAIAQAVLGLTDAQAAIMLDLEVIRSAVIGYANNGPTTPDHLQAVLAKLGIPSTLYTCTTQGNYLYQCWNYLRSAKPLIALRRWETPTAPVLHYCTVTKQTEASQTVADSWNTPAVMVTESYDLAYRMAQTASLWPSGTLIGVDRAVATP